jgi:hypothetical protein
VIVNQFHYDTRPAHHAHSGTVGATSRRGLAGLAAALWLLSACGTASAAPTPRCDESLGAITFRSTMRIDVAADTLTLPDVDGRLDCAGAGLHPCDPANPPAAYRLAWDPRRAGACFEGHWFTIGLAADESLEAARPRLAAILKRTGGKPRKAHVEVTRNTKRVNHVASGGKATCVITSSERVVVSVPGLGIGPFVSEVRGRTGYAPGTCEP